MSAVLDVVVSVSKDGTVEINKVKRSADQAEKSTKKLTNSTEKLSTQYVKMAKNIAITVAGLYAVKKTVDLITGSVVSFTNTSAMFEKYETTLKSITGSSQKAKESMAWIQDFTATTPFQLEQVTEGFVKMKAYGLNPMDGTLKTLGNTASAMGKDIVQAVEAMADAVTGENERLKEFGIKASKDGDTIAYAWADSSGKARNIVIDNNKDVIQSTLNAIFNEKYVGAMDEQSRTWDGLMSNMADSWTLFKKDIMEKSNLFAYFKSMATVIAKYMKAGFTDAKNGAKDFGDSVIDYINGTIKAIGFLGDVVSGMKLGFKAIEYAVLFMTKAVAQAINLPSQAINFLLEKYNKVADVLRFQKIDLIEPTIDTTWTTNTMEELKNEMGAIVDDLANNSGQKLAEKFIADTKAGLGGAISELDKLAKEKEDARNKLLAMGAGFGDRKDTKKDKDAKNKRDKAEKDALRAIDKLDDALQNVGDNFSNTIAGAFGVVGDEMYNFYQTYTDIMAKASAESIAQSQAEGAGATGPAVAKAGSQAGIYGAIAMAGLLAVFGMAQGGTFDSEESAPILGDIGAKTSDTLVNALDNILDVQYPMLELTREMTGYLQTISLAFGGVENSLLRSGIDIGGNLFQDTYKKGTLFGGKSTSLYGTSIKIGSATMEELINGEITAMLDTVTKTVSKKWYGAKRTYYNHKYTNISNDIGEYIQEGTMAIFDSLMSSGNTLGIDMSSLSGETIRLGTFDSTGMGAEEVASELQARFSAQVDAITEKYFGVVMEFQRAGEGLGETLYRVIVNFDQVRHSLDLIDKAVDWRTANIITDVAGGIDAFNQSFSSFTDNFYSDSERYEMQLKTMTASFKTLGITLPKSNREFRDLVEGIDTTTDAGASLFAEVISLSGAFAEMTDSAKNLGDTVSEVADAWLGNLSYLTAQQKTEYASGYYDIAKQSNGEIDRVESARLMAETALRTTARKEDYIPIFNQYVQELEAQAPKKTTDDVVYRLDTLIDRVEQLEETQRKTL